MSSRATGSDIVRVNTYVSHEQSTPAITALAGGGWTISWTTFGEDGSGFAVMQQRFDDRGIPIGRAEIVNSIAAGNQYTPAIAGLTDGGWLVTWTSDGQDGSGVGVFQQRYDPTGAPVGPEQQVNTFTPGLQDEPAITAMPDGGWIVCWRSSSQDGSLDGVYMQRFDADGLAIGAEARVNTTTEDIQNTPHLTALADGGWIVAWQSLNQDISGLGVYQQRYDASGTPVGTEQQVNTASAGQQGEPAVSALPDGGWLVTYLSGGDILMQRFAADGTREGVEARVNTTVTLDLNPSVVVLADGGWVIAWERDIGGDFYQIFQQRYDANGVAVGGETVVDTIVGPFAGRAQLTATPEGGWTVTWQVLTGDGFDVFQRHFALDIFGTAGADALVGTHWDELLLGYNGDDTLDGGGGRDVMNGGFGDDLYIVNSVGDDVREFTGQGFDTIQSSVTLSLVGDSVERLELTGTAAIDGIGNEVANEIEGNSAANTLNGNNGADFLLGNGGDDILSGGSGNDLLSGGAGNDRLAGGNGVDTAIYAAAAAGVTVNLSLNSSQSTGGAGTDIVLSIENLVGSAFDDTLTGNDLANLIEGGAGNDTLSGGLGIDTLSYDSASGAVTARLGQTSAQNTGGAGTDTISAFENLVGSAFSDVLAGNAGDNIIEGGAGNDIIDGNGGIDTASYASAASGLFIDLAVTGPQANTGAGADTLSSIENLIGSAFGDNLNGSLATNQIDGGLGSDALSGGGGADKLIGGLGIDYLTGGAGADRFIFDDGDTSRDINAADFIVDFSQSDGDRIALTQVDANSGAAGDQAFTFIGTAAFTGTAGELRYAEIGGDTFVYGDTNGDAIADLIVRFDTAVVLVAADFIL